MTTKTIHIIDYGEYMRSGVNYGTHGEYVKNSGFFGMDAIYSAQFHITYRIFDESTRGREYTLGPRCYLNGLDEFEYHPMLRVDAPRTDLYNASFQNWRFDGSNLEGSNLYQAYVCKSDFNLANMSRVSFISTVFRDCLFLFSYLQDADFRHTTFVPLLTRVGGPLDTASSFTVCAYYEETP